jgi:hypothetical protein
LLVYVVPVGGLLRFLVCGSFIKAASAKVDIVSVALFVLTASVAIDDFVHLSAPDSPPRLGRTAEIIRRGLAPGFGG